MELLSLEGKFPNSLELLDGLSSNLSCVKCKKLEKQVFVQECCLAKYCRKCVGEACGTPCTNVKCDKLEIPTIFRKDNYASSVAELIIKFNDSFVSTSTEGEKVLTKIKALGEICTLKNSIEVEGRAGGSNPMEMEEEEFIKQDKGEQEPAKSIIISHPHSTKPAPAEGSRGNGTSDEDSNLSDELMSSSNEALETFERSPLVVPASPEVFVNTPPNPIPLPSHVTTRMHDKKLRPVSTSTRESGDDEWLNPQSSSKKILDGRECEPKKYNEWVVKPDGTRSYTVDPDTLKTFHSMDELMFPWMNGILGLENSASTTSLLALPQFPLPDSGVGINVTGELTPEYLEASQISPSQSRSAAKRKRADRDDDLSPFSVEDESQVVLTPPQFTVTEPTSQTIRSSSASSTPKRSATVIIEEMLDSETCFEKELGEIEQASESFASASPNVSANSTFPSTDKEKEKRNSKGETALHIACRIGNVQKVRELLDKGADFTATDNAGWTPLHEAISGKGTDAAKAATVQLLCQRGCNVNARGWIVEDTPVHEAAITGQERIVEILLSFGAAPSIRNNDGKLPRDVADKDFIVRLLDNQDNKDDRLILTSANLANLALDDPTLHQIRSGRALFFFNFKISDRILHEVAKRLNLRIIDEFDDRVTHIVYETCSENAEDDVRLAPFGWEYLVGVAKGLWQLSYHWITKSLYHSRCLPLTDFEISGCKESTEPAFSLYKNEAFFGTTGIPGLARVNKENGNPGLLDGFTFYLHKTCAFSNLNKRSIGYLAMCAGGNITNREPSPDAIDPLEYPSRFHTLKFNDHSFTMTTHVILFRNSEKPPENKMYKLEHVKTLNLNWFISSLGQFQLLDPEEYQ